MSGSQGAWEPLSPADVAAIFPADLLWWIAGGYAIELFVGQGFRAHSDITQPPH